MNIGMYQSAASLTALERWQDAVSQNITASQVTGFKKRTVEFSGTAMGEINVGSGSSMETQSGVLPKATYGISFQSGETQPTGRPLDAALQGEGFFEVQTDDGQKAYTRAGEFHVRADRTLVTKEGAAVLSDGGSPITVQAQGGDVSISSEGMVTQGTTQLGRIGVVNFADKSNLLPIGGGFFTAKAGVQPTPVEKPQVLQGYLEASNVTPLREMVALVQIARAYEANQKLISSRDQSLQKVLETLG